MRGDLLPDEDHVVRYVQPGLVQGEEVAGAVFCRRPGEEAVSLNWLDYFKNQSRKQQLQEVRLCIRLQSSSNGRFAELKVGETRQHLFRELQALKFVEDPLPADLDTGHHEDPSHALIEGLPDPQQTPEYAEMIGAMIVECVITPLHRAKEA